MSRSKASLASQYVSKLEDTDGVIMHQDVKAKIDSVRTDIDSVETTLSLKVQDIENKVPKVFGSVTIVAEAEVGIGIATDVTINAVTSLSNASISTYYYSIDDGDYTETSVTDISLTLLGSDNQEVNLKVYAVDSLGNKSRVVEHVFLLRQPYVIAPAIPEGSQGLTNIYDDNVFSFDSFSVFKKADTHQSTDWQVATDAGFTNVIYESLLDTSNLTSTQIPGLSVSTTYYVRARYNSATTGTSEWSQTLIFTTANAFVVPGEAVFTSTATWTVPSNCFEVSVVVIGAGNSNDKCSALGVICGKNPEGVRDGGYRGGNAGSFGVGGYIDGKYYGSGAGGGGAGGYGGNGGDGQSTSYANIDSFGGGGGGTGLFGGTGLGGAGGYATYLYEFYIPASPGSSGGTSSFERTGGLRGGGTGGFYYKGGETAGGALAWRNNIPVTTGEQHTITVVGNGGVRIVWGGGRSYPSNAV